MTNSLRRQDRRALILGAIIVVAAISFSSVVRPWLDELARHRQSLTEQNRLFGHERALLTTAPAWPVTRRDVERTLAGENTRLFVGDSVTATADLSSYVADMAAGTKVRLTTMEGQSPRTTHGVTRLAVNVRGEGSWRQVLTFVHGLESSARLIDVASVRIERGARGGPLGGDLVSVSATIAGYSREAQ